MLGATFKMEWNVHLSVQKGYVYCIVQVGTYNIVLTEEEGQNGGGGVGQKQMPRGRLENISLREHQAFIDTKLMIN